MTEKSMPSQTWGWTGGLKDQILKDRLDTTGHTCLLTVTNATISDNLYYKYKSEPKGLPNVTAPEF